MPLEVKMRYKGLSTKKPELIISMNLTPRGSGNRNKARQLANHLRTDTDLGPFIGKITTGASRVVLHLPITVEMNEAVERYLTRQKDQEVHDVPGQLPLAFG